MNESESPTSQLTLLISRVMLDASASHVHTVGAEAAAEGSTGSSGAAAAADCGADGGGGGAVSTADDCSSALGVHGCMTVSNS